MTKKTLLFLLCIYSFIRVDAQPYEYKIYKTKQMTQSQKQEFEGIHKLRVKNLKTVEELPKAIDNSTSKYFPPIFSQKGNSCSQASAIRYMFTYEMNRLLDRAVAEKEENIFSYHFTWNFLNEGHDEGSFSYLGLDITKSAGAMSSKDFSDGTYSFTKWESGYDKYFRALHYRTKDYYKINLKEEKGRVELMNYLSDKGDGKNSGGVVVFSLNVSDWVVDTYRGTTNLGVNKIITKSGTEGGHAMAVAGYDLSVEFDYNKDGVISDDEKGAFLIVNSWGKSWGSDGKCYFPFKLLTIPSEEGGVLPYDGVAVCMEPEYCVPSIVFKVDVSHSSRDDIRFELGVADGANSESVESKSLVYPLILKNQGGDNYLQGLNYKEEYKTLEFALDYSSKKELIENMVAPKYFLKIKSMVRGKKGSGKINSVSVLDYRKDEKAPEIYKAKIKEGVIKYDNIVEIPTLNWCIDENGNWYEIVKSSLNLIAKNIKEFYNDSKGVLCVKTAQGNYSKLRISNYSKGKIKLDIVYQTNGTNKMAENEK